MIDLSLTNNAFEKKVEISPEKIDVAVDNAVEKLYELMPRFLNSFAPPSTVNFRYAQAKNDNWICGMQTGQYWLAYMLTGDEQLREFAHRHGGSFTSRLENKIGIDTHDLGFIYSPSCVAEFKICADKKARDTALAAADALYQLRYSERDGFIMRGGYRIIIDTMMNIPLFFWASAETGDIKYKDAAIKHYKNTEKYLVRDDFSTFHHFKINSENGEPIGGLTFQGHADSSCWARGHSWGIYGFPIAYSYCKDKNILQFYKNYVYYFLNNLPSDNIPYWDFDFREGDNAPRDSSAAAIAVCGLDEMCRMLPQGSQDRRIYENARDAMMKALIEKCANCGDKEKDGLLLHVTHALPQGEGIDECAVYGDYFYLEALARYKMKDKYIRFW